MNARRATRPKQSETGSSSPYPVSDAQLVEVARLMPALIHAMSKAGPRVPPILKRSWGALGERHVRVLIALSSGPQSVGQLSSQLGVTLSTASLLVGELSRVGFVVRTEDPNDRRRTIVELAPPHSQEVSDFMAQRAALLRSALEELEPKERTALVKGLRALVAALESSALTSSD